MNKYYETNLYNSKGNVGWRLSKGAGAGFGAGVGISCSESDADVIKDLEGGNTDFLVSVGTGSYVGGGALISDTKVYEIRENSIAGKMMKKALEITNLDFKSEE